MVYSRHPPVSAGGVEPPTKFLKRVCLTGSEFLEGGSWERGGDLIQGGCSFYVKSNLKSELNNSLQI